VKNLAGGYAFHRIGKKQNPASRFTGHVSTPTDVRVRVRGRTHGSCSRMTPASGWCRRLSAVSNLTRHLAVPRRGRVQFGTRLARNRHGPDLFGKEETGRTTIFP